MSGDLRPRRAIVAVAALALAVACTPKAPPLRGDVAPARIPAASLPLVHQKIVFTWRYADRSYRARGEGVARVSPPDSARLDFFLERGMGGGRAVLIDEELRAPDADMVRKVLPSTALLWGALGRLSIGSPPDTTARIEGDTLRVEVGGDRRWRITFVRDTLRELMLLDDARIRQFVRRDGRRQVRFHDARGGRELQLEIVRVDTVPGGFDASIWR